jgi:pSer/pThr/pTyr-binding forkhead associated (FHA) protein
MPARYSLSEAEYHRWPILAPIKTSGPPAEPVLSIALDRPVCVVGARVLVHLPLTSRQVSKSQALIVIDINGVYLRDLSSKNQTLVNGQGVCEAWLEKGDTVQFGPHQFQCQSGFVPRGGPIPIPQGELHLEPDGLGSRRTVPLEQYTFLIGSRDGCELTLRGAEISLAHAVIFARDGARYLRDLSSLTGTFVNDQPIREVELREGDQIRIGSTQLKYYPIGNIRTQGDQQAENEVLPVVDDNAPDLVVAESLHDESTVGEHSPWDEGEIRVKFDGEAELVAVGASEEG